MGFQMNREAYQKLVDEDIEWLDKMMKEHDPNSLEGNHIREIVRCSVERIYGKKEQITSNIRT